MSRRMPHRAAVLVLIASLGITIPPARAVQTRSGIGPIGQPDFFILTFVYNMIDFLRSISVTKEDPPPNPPGSDPSPNPGEGSASNPLGRPPG
jgi:hypothetical protein